MTSKPSVHQITLIPGDGIGPEVIAAVQLILAAAEVAVDWDVQHAGGTVFKRGIASGVPAETIASIRRTFSTSQTESGCPLSRVALESLLVGACSEFSFICLASSSAASASTSCFDA